MDLFQQLQNEFGDALTLRAAAGTDAVDETMPQGCAAPRDEEAARALVAWCGRAGVAFITRGGGTKLHLGARPQRCDLLLSTEHLNRVLEHDEGNATVTAQAGIAAGDLNSHVGERGQWVPLDGAHEGSLATLGGIVATNHSGASKLRYGAPRDLVVGLNAVLSDGRLVKAGSKVVKNVSGYDLNKIFIGSLGTLGLVTQVIVRLRPNDAAQAAWQGQFSSWGEVADMARFIHDGPFEPAALRISSDASGLRLKLHFSGGDTAVQTQMARLPAQTDEDNLQTELDGSLIVRAILPPQKALAWAQSAQTSGAAFIEWDYGLGRVRAAFEAAPDQSRAIVDDLRRDAEASEGFLMVERAPAALKTPEFVWGAPRAEFALMRRLKNAFDAAGVCAPGRFIGGL